MIIILLETAWFKDDKFYRIGRYRLFLKRVDHGQGERKTTNFSCLNLVLLYFVDTDTKLDICADFKHNLTVYKIYDWDSRPRPHDAP